MRNPIAMQYLNACRSFYTSNPMYWDPVEARLVAFAAIAKRHRGASIHRHAHQIIRVLDGIQRLARPDTGIALGAH